MSVGPIAGQRRLERQAATQSRGQPEAERVAELQATPMPLVAPPAELEHDGDWQISAASAKIVSGFSLETNGYRLGFRLPHRGGSPEFQTHCSSPGNGLVQRRIVWRLLDLLIGCPLAWVICLLVRSLRLLRAAQILNR
jgi:hypothetical protein